MQPPLSSARPSSIQQASPDRLDDEKARPPRARALVPSARRKSLSFDQHPAHRELMAVRSLAVMAGVRDPHYRCHQGRAGSRTEIDGRELINFASYDYLGLNCHTEILQAHAEAAAKYGTSVSGSRLTSGERPVHAALEASLAEVYRAEAALVFVSGHATAGSVLQTLMGPRDLILYDAWIHNCVVTGAEAVRCQRRSFPHNDLDEVDRYLQENRDRFDNVVIVTEGLFSMDGDGCDLARLLVLKARHGAWLMVDEAHALGVLGATGNGIAEHAGLDPSGVDIWFGTLSKALVGCGGYVCGSRALVDILRARAPGLVYSVGMPAPTAAASLQALRIMQREPQRVAALQANSHYFWRGVQALGLDIGTSWGVGIVPVIIGADFPTLQVAERLEARGIYAFPVVAGGVPEGTARLRFFLSASHSQEDLEAALRALEGVVA